MMNSQKSVIFYGAGRYAERNLSRWVCKEIIPACFADADESKHYKSIIDEKSGRKFEVLPLDEAIKRYPEYEIYITVIPYAAKKVFLDLVQGGIQKERMRLNPEVAQKPQSCPNIGKYLVLDGLGIKTCCTYQSETIPSKGSFAEDVKDYYDYCASLQDDLNNARFTSCLGCYMLRDGGSQNVHEIKEINLSTGLPGGDTCNFTCCYCTYGESLGACNRNDHVLEILREIESTLNIDKLSYACGEISVSPYRKEIIDIWKRNNWDGTILTNASLFCEDIYDLLCGGLVGLNCSLDAGNAETFARVKGVDCWNDVIGNLKKYRTSGAKIELKYVLLDGINTDEANIDGFLKIVKEVGTNVRVSRDFKRANVPMSEREYSMFKRLVYCLNEKQIPFLIVTDPLLLDEQRIHIDGLIPLRS